MLANKSIITVSELNAYLKERLEADGHLANLWVAGEISNLKVPSSGHMYFTLKDEYSSVRCVMFRFYNRSLSFTLNQGMQVICRGYVSVYERDGQYQLYVQEMVTRGMGNLHLAFEQLKTKLQNEGLFDPAAKKPIPVLPRKIGIVTSPTGAAIRDIITVICRRFPNVHLLLAPTSVQGEAAPGEIAGALELLNRHGQADVIIVGRGGGSLEELWAFNTETVARAIFASRIPVVSAVGHETDFTIADFTADRRAPTPSAAAEMVVPSKKELERYVLTLQTRLTKSMSNLLASYRERVSRLARRRVLTGPFSSLADQQQYVDGLQRRLVKSINSYVQAKRSLLAALAARLHTLSPLNILSRGYAICRAESGREITDSSEVILEQPVEIILRRGALLCQVKGKKEELEWQKTLDDQIQKMN